MPIDGDAYRRHFPVGFYIDTSDTTDVRTVGSTTPTTLTLNQPAGIRGVIRHPDAGCKATGNTYLFMNGQQPYTQETVLGMSTAIEAEVKDGNIYQVCGIYQKPIVTAGTGWDTWFAEPYDVGYHTEAAAQTIAERYAPIYEDHPSVLAFNLRDDSNPDERSRLAVVAMQAADPRPAACMWSNGPPPGIGDDLKLFISYTYPCGKKSDASDTPEGDFHRHTFSNIFSGADWVDRLRTLFTNVPASVPKWLMLQAHDTADVDNTSLRYPTTREMRKQVWVAIGEGVHGFFWFAWGKSTGSWLGLSDVTRTDYMHVAAEMAGRLTPKIRKAILGTVRDTDEPFEVTGGATSGYSFDYTSAYISTLYDSALDKYYVVLCNHKTSSATVTVTSDTLTGKLTNMETGEYFIIGGTVDLPALDGGIWEYDPYIGVPHWEPNLGQDVETWWSEHWMNPWQDFDDPSPSVANPNHWGEDDITHWPTEVVVSPGAGTIQAALDANPGDYITFRLEDGTYTGITEVVGREHIHFIADDPLNRPTVNGSFIVLGTENFRYYNGTLEPTIGSQTHLVGTSPGWTGRTESVVLEHLNPKRDFIWKDIDFDGTGLIINEHFQGIFDTGFPDGRWRVDHIAEHSPIFVRNVTDVLVQNCTFSNTTWGDDKYPGQNTVTSPAYPDPLTPSDTTGSPSRWHPGMIGGNSGVHNFCARGNTFNGSSTARGTVYAVFIDGSQGAVMYDNVTTGKFHGGEFLFLTNDDFTIDIARDGRMSEYPDMRNAKYNVVANNTLVNNGGYIISFTGQDNLATGNTMNTGTGSNMQFVQIVSRCQSRHTALSPANRYRSRRNVISNNTITATSGTIARFVTYDVDSRRCSDYAADSSKWSVIGRSIIKNNTYGGVVTAWALDLPGASYGPSEGGDTFLNNTDSGGSRDTA